MADLRSVPSVAELKEFAAVDVVANAPSGSRFIFAKDGALYEIGASGVALRIASAVLDSVRKESHITLVFDEPGVNIP